MRIFVLFSICVIFAGECLEAQDLEEKNFIRYTRLQGLSNNYISGIVQDSTGFMWIATHKGINRFDGKIFQSVFKSSPHSWLPDNMLVRVHRTNNEIIGATRAGAFAFDPESGRYKQFIIPCDSSIYFWTNNVFDIGKDKKGNYILSTKTGLYVFSDTGKLVKRYDYHFPNEVGKLELIFGGWVSALDNGSTLQQNGLFGSMYDPDINQIDTLFVARRDHLKKFLTDSMGEMKPSWSGKNEELFILNPDRNSIDVTDIYSPASTTNSMPFNVKVNLGWTSKLTYLNDSLLAITCKNNGFYLLHYNKGTKQLTGDSKKYFERDVCTSVFKDREGRLWIGTADGIYKQNLHNSFFSVNDLSEQSPGLLDHEIKSIYIEGDSIFAGLQNEGGLLVLDKRTGNIKRQLQFTPVKEFSNSIINIFPYATDTLWIATTNGILWLNKKNYHCGQLKTPAQLGWMQKTNARCFFEDSKKNIWISFGKLNSLVRYSRITQTFSEISTSSNPLLKITFVFSMAEDYQNCSEI